MKRMVYIAVVALVAIMTSCTSSEFKVNIDISGLGNQNLHVVWMDDKGLTDAFVTAEDGKLSIGGNCHEPTVVGILDSYNKPLVRIVVTGGDNITVTGDANNPHHYRCSGNEAAQEWLAFESKHASLYDVPDRAPLDKAIEKYVAENPESLVSTLLLVVDYSDAKKASALLDKVAMKVRPASLCESVERVMAVVEKKDDTLRTMMLCGTEGDFEPVLAAQQGVTLFYMWHESRNERRENVQSMKWLSRHWGNRLTIVDVSLMPDTLGWRSVARLDSASWKHYWVPGSVLDPAVETLRLRTLPETFVTDSTGRILYRGNDMTAVNNTLEKHFGRQ